ncbi:Outer membrane porin F precursor [Serratia entomophila]|uniref:OmpA family protein n=1 Tax=Serratia entomophila TaxID=42906 RepID=A0ABY5CQ47_9GAMM|nr:OmpA family protein [Serratia entomophila]USV00146.1 OmpA family protein [Serratia entomophila]CAI0924838.1 Outer membrane porin F precursor [Serratia entomophila]CAI0933239.1 Outer membrane porin F precursor [Serratia entomophila]CAI0951387.1 Outer membrane porin F precursor [Serratia entomophila]CAI0956759.1 Outer membrane porin F precursor [Serratia entomophila]
MNGLGKIACVGWLSIFGLASSGACAEGGEPASVGKPVILDLKATRLDLIGLPSGLNANVLDLQSKAEDLAKKSPDISVRNSNTAVTLSIRSDVLFAFDSDAVSSKAEPALRQVAQFIAADSAGVVTVEGHTDAVGSETYNQDLSLRRARAVATWLSMHGVEKSRLSERGKGEAEPVAGNDTSEGRAKNRRVDFVLPKKAAAG